MAGPSWLDPDQLLWTSRQEFVASFGQHREVFDPHARVAGDVRARLDGHDHAGF